MVIVGFSEWLASRNRELFRIHGMNDIDNQIQTIFPVEARFVVQSASRGARRSDAQEVHVEVPCDLHVEAPCARR